VRMISLREIIGRTEAIYRDETALRADRGPMTYAELFAAVNRLGEAFIRRGLEKQTAVMLLMWNRKEFIISDLALMKTGLVKVPLNHMVSKEDIVYRANHAKTRIIICD